jgi:hypothetical protein
MRSRLPFNKGRKWSIKQAEKNGVEVKLSTDFKAFIGIVEQLLSDKYDARPVHTAAEMELLASRFPENIKLFGAYKGDELVGGAIIYESDQVAHAQYLGASERGKEMGALDLIMSHLLNEYYSDNKYFDFGKSTEGDGRKLNAGLIENKQGYGARAIVYDFYELQIQE